MSRYLGTTATPQPEDDGDHSNHSQPKGDWRRVGSGMFDPYPQDVVPFDELKSKEARTVFSLETRARIRQAAAQLERIVVTRMFQADRPQAVATREGLILEIKAIAEAQVKGEPEDVRAAYLTAAASMVLLAEAADRPPETPAYVERYRKTNPKREWGP